MSNTRYSVYRNNTLDLVRTLVVKSEMTADAINIDLTSLGNTVLESYPDTWKYYMNMAGEYHSTDMPMSIISLDTLEVIAFTKANLLIHRTTAKGYVYGTRYYKELVAKFPAQEALILGILNPVDKAIAIDAANGKILYFNEALVEENEYNLIPNLQAWIDKFFIRWDVTDYRLTDDLYAAALLAVMFSLMPGVIMDIRTANCKTNQAHSYHIREYLASNGRLDRYMDILDKRQALFLYRNIKYIHHNAGKESTFRLLIDRILSARNFPLAAYEMRHNTEGMPTRLTPTIELVQSPLNLQQVEGRDDVITVAEMLIKEQGLARDNAIDLVDAERVVTETMTTAYTNRVKTKVLESVVVDNSDDGPYRFVDTLLNQWIYLAFRNKYQGVVAFVDPSNGETITLSTRDAFIFYLYCMNGSFGVAIETIPTIQAMGVRRLNIPTLAELKAMVDGELLSDAYLNSLIDGVDPITTTISSEGFFLETKAIHTRLLLHRLQYTSVEHQEANGMARGAVWRFYVDATVELAPSGTLYADWLHDRGLDVQNYSPIDYEKLFTNIGIAATGVDNNSAITLKDIQAGSLRLMSQLSSYTVQYIPTINTEPYTATEWAAIRQGKILIKEHQQDFVKNAQLQPLALRSHMKANVLSSVVYEVADYDWDARDRVLITEDINVPTEYNIRPLTRIYSQMATIEVTDLVEQYYPPANTPVLLSFISARSSGLQAPVQNKVVVPLISSKHEAMTASIVIVPTGPGPALSSMFSSTSLPLNSIYPLYNP